MLKPVHIKRTSRPLFLMVFLLSQHSIEMGFKNKELQGCKNNHQIFEDFSSCFPDTLFNLECLFSNIYCSDDSV